MPNNMKNAGMSYAGKGGNIYGKGGATHKAKCGTAIKVGKMSCGGTVSKVINGASLRPKR